MEQENSLSQGTKATPEVPSSPHHSEKDNTKKDMIPTEGSGKPEPESSSKPEPESFSKPEPEEFIQPDPERSSLPEPSDKSTPQSLKAISKMLKKPKVVKGRKTNAPRQVHGKNIDNSNKDSIPPEGSTQPSPEGSTQQESSDKNTPRALKDTILTEESGNPNPESSSKPEPESSCKPESEGYTQPDLQGSSLLEPSGKNTPQPLKAKSKILKKSKAVKVKTNGSRQVRGKKLDNSKDTIPLEGSSKPKPEGFTQPVDEGSTQPVPEGSTKPAPEGSTKPAPEGSTQPEPSDKNTPQALKAKAKILKKPMAVKVTANGSQQILHKRRKRKNKKTVGNMDEPAKENELRAEESKEKESQNRHSSDKIHIIELDRRERKRRNKGKHRGLDKGARCRADKAKHSGVVNTESSEKKREKPGGFIFMCSGKTKPDCFRYRVMGVTAAKKDVVLGIKPGMVLFLYDFDLKLLYGIYRASSSGGMKLEPRAFGGNFPAQVRFSVDRDCFPLPESIFRKAIKENYDERHKFKTELTVRQVRKLTKLFRPVEVRSAVQPVYSPPKAIIQGNEDLDDVRASRSHLHRERASGDRYNVLSRERDPRAYGLQGDGRNVASASFVNPIREREPYRSDYEREHFHHLDPIYRENVLARIESLHADPRHLNESEHQAFFRGAILERAEDPYHAYRYGASPRDPYLPPLSREDISLSSYRGRTLIGADNFQRRETAHDRQYSAYSAADAFADFDRAQYYHREKLDATSLPVSSRYSFGGPSYSLR